MKYYITNKVKEIEGYKRVKFTANIDYQDDTLLFDDLNMANKFRYYYPTNKIEVMLKRCDIKRRHQIRALIRRKPDVKFIWPKSILGKIAFMLIVFLYQTTFYWFRQKEKPTHIIVGNLNGKNIYILENKVINGYSYSGVQNTTHYWQHESDIPFDDYELFEHDIKVYNRDLDPEAIWYPEEYDYVIEEEVFKKIGFKPLVYVYNVEINDEETIIDVMYQNYMHLKNSPVIEASVEYEVLDNEIDAKYYSKTSLPYAENFKRIKFKTTDEVKFNFYYNDIYMNIMLVRKVFNKVLINDYRLKASRVSLYIEKINPMTDLLKREQNFVEIQSKLSEKPIYLFQDRPNKADDNAESLYRYYMNNNPGYELYYALDAESACYERLAQEGFNLVDFGSDLHKEIYLRCDKLITSHAARRIYDPFYPQKLHRSFEKFKFIFLQHGMIMGNHHGFLDYINNQIDLFVTSSFEEQELVKNFSGYNNVVLTGLPRFDNYKDNQLGDYIIYAPSWNTLYADDLEHSPYVKEIEKVINDERLVNVLAKKDIKVKLILHPEFISLDVPIKNDYGVIICQADTFNYKEELRNCLGLITDYSSLFFDVLYQGKFVIHHQPYELHHDNDQITTFIDSIDKTYNIKELESCFSELDKRKYRMSDKQLKNLEKVFVNRDSENCKRNMIEIEKI